VGGQISLAGLVQNAGRFDITQHDGNSCRDGSSRNGIRNGNEI